MIRALRAIHPGDNLWPVLLVMVCCLLGGIAGFFVHPVLLVVIGVLPWAAFIALRYPFLMVLLFVIFSFFRLHEVLPFLYPFRLPQLLALGALASLAVNYVIGNLRIYWCQELTLFSVLFALLTIGLLFSSNRAVSMEHYTGTFVKIGIMTYAICWLITRPQQLFVVQKVLVGIGILVGMVALYNKVNGIGIVEHTRVTIGRDIGSMLGDPNDLALVLLFPASFALGLALTKGVGRFARFWGGLGFLVVVAAILATQSRGGLLGIAAICGVFGRQYIRSNAVLIGLGLVGLIGLFLVAGIEGRAVGGAADEGLDESSKARLYAWLAAVKMAFDNPLTGVGMMCFSQNYFIYTDWWDGKAYNVHSTWFGLLSEAGLLGFCLYLALFIATAKTVQTLLQAFKAPANKSDALFLAFSRALWGGLAGFAVSGAFLSQAFLWPFYIMLAFTIGAARCAGSVNHH